MANVITVWFNPMKAESVEFFKAVGLRLAQLRQDHGLTQNQLAEKAGIKQYVIASYETGRRRIPASLLPVLAKILGISVEEIVGDVRGKTMKRGPASRLERQIQQVQTLPESKQKFVSEFLDTVLQKAR